MSASREAQKDVNASITLSLSSSTLYLSMCLRRDRDSTTSTKPQTVSSVRVSTYHTQAKNGMKTLDAGDESTGERETRHQVMFLQPAGSGEGLLKRERESPLHSSEFHHALRITVFLAHRLDCRHGLLRHCVKHGVGEAIPLCWVACVPHDEEKVSLRVYVLHVHL